MIARLILLAILSTAFAPGTPLTVTITVTGSGFLGSTQFRGTPFTLTFTTDTTLLVTPACCTATATPPGTPTTFSMPGGASGTVMGNPSVFVSTNPPSDISAVPGYGVWAYGGDELFDFTSMAFAGYRLTTSLGPITGPPRFVDSSLSFVTSAGTLSFNSINTVTFNAVVSGGPGPPAQMPAIGGVVSASAFGGFSTVAPGSWVEIYGSTLAPDTRQWAGTDFTGVNAPTTLDGVQVTIGSQKAFVDYISSGQVNAQLPSNIGTGPTQIIVTNGSVNSAPFNITVNTTQPGLLAPPSFKIGGNQYVVAQFSDGTYVLPAGSIAGVSSRPAAPGETIVIYGVGFGSVTPNIPAGQIVTQANQLSLPLQIMFGQTTAQASYFGLAPNFVGLYQFNVVVPAVTNSDLVPLTFKLGGAAVAQTLYIAVRQ